MSEPNPAQTIRRSPQDAQVESLPVLQRLALSYCPKASREATLGLLSLDTRLASILRSSSEPMLAQLRLAWWRETLGRPAEEWPAGEPILSLLTGWNGHQAALMGLAEGWEALTEPAPLSASAIEKLAEARGAAFGALANIAGHSAGRSAAQNMGTQWAFADLASRLSDPQEREAALSRANNRDWRRHRLPRALRPLAVLHALSARAMRRGERLDAMSPGALATAARAGLFGL